MSEKFPIKIVVATHKAYPMPADEIYFPLQVGTEGKTDADGRPLDLGFPKDNTGENISAKNPSYCELTGLYWAWKNLDADYLGLVHYRRHFTVKSKVYRRRHAPLDCVVTSEELKPLVARYPILVPKKRHYVIETLYSHYAHTHYAEHLDVTREILAEHCPAYLDAFDRVMRQRSGHMFNMYVMERSLSDAYCAWLFDILGELENRLADRDYTAYQGRLYGRVSELLFNVWLATRPEAVGELGYLPIEKERWLRKGAAFLRAKGGKRYEESF